MNSTSTLVSKYNVPGPRYTSYPTVPFWKKENWDQTEWITVLNKGLLEQKDKQLSLYIHLPYCDTLCTFCGCHKHISTNHSLESPYIDALLKELKLYVDQFSIQPNVGEIHLGGGTPTFFSANQLKRLIQGITKLVPICETAELSFEAHPNSTEVAHLEILSALGFKRVSFGIQDYDPIVQKAIHRVQSFESVTKVHTNAKIAGFTSISHDLVFGLPKQTICGFKATILKTLALQPDRISLYSYAHVPWVKGTGQRGFDENDIPGPTQKRLLYELAKSLFTDAGYIEIGMDHFALPHDALAIAAQNGTLHRNFMGYTTKSSNLLLGLGMSAISDAWFGFAQNEKTVKKYIERVSLGEIPLTKGHLLSTSDLEIRKHILSLMCQFETKIEKGSSIKLPELIKRLRPMIADELVNVFQNRIKITQKGIPFVRNCCMAFDTYLNTPFTEKKFSMTI